MKDFTLRTYSLLLKSLQEADYAFFTFEEWCDGKAIGRYVILRHDIDLKVLNSLKIARIEAEMGIRSTYYFRLIPQSDQLGIIHSIAELGHEIGYHYEDLSLFHGDKVKAIANFQHQLELFRQFYPVRTICMHGSPTSKWDNRDLWKTYDYKDYGVIGEPYLDFLNTSFRKNLENIYFTDTARMWDGEKYNLRDKKTVNSDKLLVISDQLKVKGDPLSLIAIHSTFDFIDWLNSKPNQNIMMITTHPQRWTDNKIEWYVEFALQNIKNFVKHWFIIRRYYK